MAEPTLPHVDIAGWLLGDLDPEDYGGTAAHLATCDECRTIADELRATADRALMAGPESEPSSDLEDRIVAAIHDEANPTPVDTPDDQVPHGLIPDGLIPTDVPAADGVSGEQARPAPVDPTQPEGRRDSRRPGGGRSGRDLPRWVRPLVGLTVAALVIAALVVGLGRGAPGEVELDTPLIAVTDTDVTANVVVRKLGTGRAVDVTSDNLPILPDGGLYELWFVGPGDTPENPNRVSAGTFHPDEDGITEVVLHAAVVPSEYPTVVITAEPKDGDPSVNGPEVVRSTG